MSDEEKIETFDEKRGVGIRSGQPPTKWQGPRRRAPRYYAGERYSGHRINHPDVERYPANYVPALRGKTASIRDKAARRIVRGALKRHYSSVEKALKLPRAMLEQARLIAREEKKSPRWARRLFEKELAIHEPVYVPSQKELRAMRTAKRKLKRQGKVDAITALVDRMAKP